MEDFKNTESGKVPRHVSIIMDGNGRWAQQRGKERVFGHSHGVESVRACVEASVEPQAEVSTLMGLMFKAIADEVSALKKQGVRFRTLGDFSRLDPALVEAIRSAEAATAPEEGKEPVLDLIVFLSYSGKWDILQAAKKLALDCAGDISRLENVGPDDFASRLVTCDIPDPDLIIRTSGESRLSNYLLWQAAYSEFLFVDTLWPDFGKEEFKSALSEYSKRDRRYGKVK